ncbi:MAG TPA: hypothetical protein PLX57_08320 [Ornithinibacter sp.]|jgi:hypothetical protein|uniref:hypothetical protein n=1 Tax=Ornithinibacter sp. TaxID=2862748 RepID=UPI001B4FF05E|nr:hypothetical protein [Ornithinibacter sp.]MBP6524628.1 hypothetical protein [Dermatophilaceae bacterium]MBU9943555.1 hypothetical protein [Dermatophilaceae bacterium]HOB79848.1 hypothetical protein [Ornithinibacter sp.]HQA13509.1 hypothetical protein [Ornithinibacter sp.]HQD67789.1 hypothetical protein [Ornithinibacter sp.]
MGTWGELAAVQAGALSHRQLTELKVTRATVRNKLESGRWQRRTEEVITTTTGPMSVEQHRWVAVLHCGPGALVGGLSAAAVHGLKNWHRDEVHVLVGNDHSFEPVEGVVTFRTRRSLPRMRHPSPLPTCALEPAVLLWAGHEPHPRSAMGVLAAVVQQRLTTAAKLASWVEALKPLRRAPAIRSLLTDLAGGSQSMAEVDVLQMCRGAGLAIPDRQVPRRDSSGQLRFTDCEWHLKDGRTLVLEVDGLFHLEIQHYEGDVRRQRRLTTPTRIVVRCTSNELRHEPWVLAADLRALGVPPA